MTGKQWKTAFKEVCKHYSKTMTDRLNEFLREQVREFVKRQKKENEI